MGEELEVRRRIDIEDEPALSRLLRGKGFVLPHDTNHGLVVLLRGKAGTGKSTFALQLLDRMHECGGQRVYCTLEQSKQDLEVKRARMWATRAVDGAWQASYREEKLVIDETSLVKMLGNRLADSAVQAALRASRQGSLPDAPLFDEPDDQGRGRFNTFLDALTDSIQQQCANLAPPESAKQIEIWDGKEPKEGSSSGQPFAGLYRRCVSAEMMVNKLCEQSSDKLSRQGRPIVVLDGLSLLSQLDREAVALEAIVEKLRQNAELAILVYEPNAEEAPYLDHHADMVIELTEDQVGQPNKYLIHQLCITKARYQEAALGRHQFKIRGSGIDILPSLHFQVHHHHYMDMELVRSSGPNPKDTPSVPAQEHGDRNIGSLIDIICRPNPGEAVVLLGPRNAFKTALCLDYLSCGTWGCPMNKGPEDLGAGLLVSLIDNAPDIQRGLKCPWQKQSLTCPWKPEGCDDKESHVWHARPYCQRPGYITPAEFFHYLKTRTDRMHDGDRVVFWDLTQMDYRFPLFCDDRMLLPALMDSFRTQKMRSLFMGAGNASNSRAASAMADHVIFCWRSAGEPEEAKGTEGGSGEKPRTAALMLYVDRASAASSRPAQALYRIPIKAGDNEAGDKLVLTNIGNLDRYETKKGHRVDLLALGPNHPDARAIRRITSMQDVPGEMSSGW